jgi:soluble lytic murein transglycosylase-like protein
MEMQPNRQPISALLSLFMGVALAAPAAVDGGEPTYKYREDDGTVWFTDQRPSGANFDDYEFLGYHGRPPARSSCRGLTDRQRARRYARIETPLRRATRRHGADLLLIKAIVAVESCFDPRAVSAVGARGLMQLMPSTARDLGVEEPFNIEANLDGGIRYFKRLRQRFAGDLDTTLAAYNAGPGAVERHGGIPPYPQTKRYVERVREQLRHYRDGARP